MRALRAHSLRPVASHQLIVQKQRPAALLAPPAAFQRHCARQQSCQKSAASQRPLHICRAAATAADGEAPAAKTKGWLEQQQANLQSLLTPFSDKAINNKLLALCVAQALCSVATLIHDTYLPVYLQDVLGLSNTKIGNLQAISQFLCNASKSLSGTLADILSPARMIIFGTLLTTLNKPMFAGSGYVYAAFGTVATLYWVTAGKVFDRMSKGIREAPGKALIGLRQAMATFGALLGASIAGLAYKLSGQNYIATFALATVPAVMALVLTVSAFRDMAKSAGEAKKAAKDKADALVAAGGEAEVRLSLPQKARAVAGALQPAYWQALIVVSLLYFARFDASFITLRAKVVMSKAQLPLLTSIMMVVQAFVSAPAGLRAKRSIKDRNQVLLLGYAAMIAADMTFALVPSVFGMLVGSFFVGVHMAMTHGVTLGMVASYIPATQVPGIGRITGTCWSFTDFIFGVILAYSNSVAGRLSDITVRSGAGNIGCFFGGTLATVTSGAALILFSTFGALGREDAVTTRKPKAA